MASDAPHWGNVELGSTASAPSRTAPDASLIRRRERSCSDNFKQSEISLDDEVAVLGVALREHLDARHEGRRREQKDVGSAHLD